LVPQIKETLTTVKPVKFAKGDLLRPSEVAAYFGMSVKTIYGWVAEGKIKAVKVGPDGAIRITKEGVESMIHPIID
jgi:excisionase family DNA binding protein